MMEANDEEDTKLRLCVLYNQYNRLDGNKWNKWTVVYCGTVFRWWFLVFWLRVDGITLVLYVHFCAGVRQSKKFIPMIGSMLVLSYCCSIVSSLVSEACKNHGSAKFCESRWWWGHEIDEVFLLKINKWDRLGRGGQRENPFFFSHDFSLYGGKKSRS